MGILKWQGNECCSITIPGHHPPCKLCSLKHFLKLVKKNFSESMCISYITFWWPKRFRKRRFSVIGSSWLKEYSLLTSHGKDWVTHCCWYRNGRSCFHLGAKEDTESGVSFIEKNCRYSKFTYGQANEGVRRINQQLFTQTLSNKVI